VKTNKTDFGIAGFMARMASVLPGFVVSAGYLVAWYSPALTGTSCLPGLVMLMLLEFVNIPLSACMATSALFDHRWNVLVWGLVARKDVYR